MQEKPRVIYNKLNNLHAVKEEGVRGEKMKNTMYINSMIER